MRRMKHFLAILFLVGLLCIPNIAVYAKELEICRLCNGAGDYHCIWCNNAVDVVCDDCGGSGGNIAKNKVENRSREVVANKMHIGV